LFKVVLYWIAYYLHDLIQDGTEQQFTGGKGSYYARGLPTLKNDPGSEYF
jgi:hypothetical protein